MSGKACRRCRGNGKRIYPSASMWRGGISGQAITEGPCDSCWGCGSQDEALRRVDALAGLDPDAIPAVIDALETVLDWWTATVNVEHPAELEVIESARAALARLRGEDEMP